MRFGAFTALDDVSIRVDPGTFHALLGENGAGKSTLVKCMMGFYHATSGEMMVGGHEALIRDPRDAHALGLGMVYQHFTLVPSLTAAENLVISRRDTPAVIDWGRERATLAAFMERMPFRVPLDIPVQQLSAGERQKLEILKQLYLGRRFLILDEPTSVLTPDEADEVLGHVRAMCGKGEISVLMITHKFREVTAFADEVSVLRRGRHVGSGRVADLSHADMAAMMIGAEASRTPARATASRAPRCSSLTACAPATARG
jgi:general nucleoside transport system ATP-binding protein